MAGHSKWANIKFRKNAQDKRRGKIFTKLIREITIAARVGGGGEPASNPRLRAAIDKALSANMTRDTVDRAIKRGTGEAETGAIEEITYEGYGPEGVAILVQCMTDNRNRTVGEVRHAFSRCGGNLGTEGSVAYLFTQQGILTFAPPIDENLLMEVALVVGADDVVSHDDGSVDIITTPEQFGAIKDAMAAKQWIPAHAEVVMNPSTTVALTEEAAEKFIKLVDMLEDLDDVQNVYANAVLPPAMMER